MDGLGERWLGYVGLNCFVEIGGSLIAFGFNDTNYVKESIVK